VVNLFMTVKAMVTDESKPLYDNTDFGKTMRVLD
jgi:hypothetical protein